MNARAGARGLWREPVRTFIGFGSVAFSVVALAGVSGAPFPGAVAPGGYRPYNTQRPGEEPPPPGKALARITVPDGFAVNLFAAEPDVRQPVAMAWDGRGRLWVAEAYSYKEWERKGEDRVLIFEDTDGDGRFDRRSVFYQGADHLSGLALGLGGVWLGESPQVVFIPDRDGDDRPDGPPEPVLDGFTTAGSHNFVNGFTWGPDGWLYGRHGMLAVSRVGLPGTPADERVEVDCSIWRYHPVRKVFEVVARGTVNPWGLDYDEHGEMFFTNNVSEHLWHLVPGSLFERWKRPGFFPHAYARMGSCADHFHHAGEAWRSDWTKTRGGAGAHGERGGGHSHSGGMIYLGGAWPQRYHNTVFMCNTHGHRVNNDRLERTPTGYLARHGADFLLAHDPWFRGVSLLYGPAGNVFVSDWTDFGECHDSDGVHRTSGRIYRVTYTGGAGEPAAPTLPRPDLRALDARSLAEMQLHRNDWWVREARLELQRRHLDGGEDLGAAMRRLREIFATDAREPRQLRALWALYVIGAAPPDWLRTLLSHPGEHVRAWAVRLLVDGGAAEPPPDGTENKFAEMASGDPSGLVRTHLASALGRLPAGRRAGLARALLAHPDLGRDRNLALLTWYGCEPLVAAAPATVAGFVAVCPHPLLRGFLARRATHGLADDPSGAAAVVGLIAASDHPDRHHDLLAGMEEALRGQRDLPAPEGWPALAAMLAASASPAVRGIASRLSLAFGDAGAGRELAALAEDLAAPEDERLRSLEALIEHRAEGTGRVLLSLLDDPAPGVVAAAFKGLASFPAPSIAPAILARYPNLPPATRRGAIWLLSSRRESALALLGAVAQRQISASDLHPADVRQLRSFGDAEIDRRVKQLWGATRADRQAVRERIASYRRRLTPEVLDRADLENGAAVYERSCAACHRLFGRGGRIGPDLTGSGRADLDYLLENTVDPNAVVPAPFQTVTLKTVDGRVLVGSPAREDGRTLSLQTASGVVVLPLADVADRTASTLSLMPPGLLESMSRDEVRDLIAYLSRATAPVAPAPAPAPPSGDAAPSQRP